MRLDGINGSHIFGFMAAIGSAVLADKRAGTAAKTRLYFGRDGIAHVDVDGEHQLDFAREIWRTLQELRPFYDSTLRGINKPGDFTKKSYAELAAQVDRSGADALAGLACCMGEETFESTLCAANGAGHQNLVQSIRDVLALVTEEHLAHSLFRSWTREFQVTSDLRKTFTLGARKPTLRLDPADERLYALRYANPTESDDYKTELGAQALAVPAFSVIPVLPTSRPLCIASTRARSRVYFHWPLWDRPATLATVRSLLSLGNRDVDEMRGRGVFAIYRVARVSGAKGKLSFAPSEGLW